jgi:hypothetical protein
MFERAVGKLEDARINIQTMKNARNAQEFKAAFNSFLQSAHAVTLGLQLDRNNVEGFDEWWEEKRKEMREDELLRFFYEARVDDHHHAKHPLEFPFWKLGRVVVSPPPGAVYQFRASGPVYIFDQGKPTERVVPIPGDYSVAITIKDPPKTHLGKPVNDPRPVQLCEMDLAYLEALVVEARTGSL